MIVLTLLNVGGKIIHAPQNRDIILNVLTLVAPHNMETLDLSPVSILFYD